MTAPRLLSDENFSGAILRGVRRRFPEIDLVRVQDVGLSKATDKEILEWAAIHDRVLITHDIATVPGYAMERVRDGLRMPGVIVIPQLRTIGYAIEEILLFVEYGHAESFEDRVHFG